MRFLIASGLWAVVSCAHASITIDTTANPGSGVLGYQGAGQSLTIPSGNEVFDNIGFSFAPESYGRTYGFALRDGPPGQNSSATQTFLLAEFVVQPGINVIDIGLEFTAGQQVFANVILDYNNFGGTIPRNLLFTPDLYSGGNLYLIDRTSFQTITFPNLDLRFIANFSPPTDDAAVPECGTLAIWSLGALGCSIAVACRCNGRAA